MQKFPWIAGRTVFSFALIVAALAAPAFAGAADLVLGPVTIQRGTGAPTVFNYTFTAPESNHGFVLKVYNGGLEDTTYELVSSSTITLNGTEILGPNNFNQHITYLEVPVALQAQNEMSVVVRGKLGGAMLLKLFPVIEIHAPAANKVFGSQPAVVSGSLYAAASGVTVNGISATLDASGFSASGVPLVEGRNEIVAIALGPGGITAADDRVTVVLDTIPPLVTIAHPPEELYTN